MAREGDDHFSVDGTLVKAWASMKSFQPKAGDMPPDDDPGSPARPDRPTEDCPEPTKTDPMPRTTHQNRNAEVDFRGGKRSNTTHASTTDPDVRLYKTPRHRGDAVLHGWGIVFPTTALMWRIARA